MAVSLCIAPILGVTQGTTAFHTGGNTALGKSETLAKVKQCPGLSFNSLQLSAVVGGMMLPSWFVWICFSAWREDLRRGDDTKNLEAWRVIQGSMWAGGPCKKPAGGTE